MAVKYRALTKKEIEQLERQGCACEDWRQVKVRSRFDARTVQSSRFSGKIRLGEFEKSVRFCGSVKKTSGISNATIHNCVIGDDVYIDQVRSYIANYVIEDGAVIENCDLIVVDGESSFGNGTEVAVLNEAGGREVAIYDGLSAHTAYILALYRHRPKVIKKIRRMIKGYAKSVTSSMGLIGEGARLLNCRTIKNVRIGGYSVIEGVDRLENGSVNSCKEDKVYIGPSVIAENFIASEGAVISEGTMIINCFVGQGCVLGKQYSADNSVFFANCVGYHGEASAVFAGPYTVTHHKSTLLIAGLFSFLNAGSGSNQSNHMYKLGPVHEGIVERGSKTTSDSYILWPARVGAFSLVMGRHYRNSDTSELPFSYLIEHEDESVLVPGVNLRSIGTVRDAAKWPKRDRRKITGKLDYINFKLLSPYTVQKMLNGIGVLENIRKTSGQATEFFTYNNVKIKMGSLENGIKFYEMGIDKYLGNCLVSRLMDKKIKTTEQLRDALAYKGKTGMGKWLDLAGLFAPAGIIEKVLGDIEAGKINKLEKLQERFKQIHERYSAYEWEWAADIIEQKSGKKISQITAEEIIEIIKRWEKAVVELDEMHISDAKKDFSETMQIGYGIDGDEKIKQKDFAAVRGNFEGNSFVASIKKHTEEKKAMAEKLTEELQKVK